MLIRSGMLPSTDGLGGDSTLPISVSNGQDLELIDMILFEMSGAYVA